MIHTSLQIQLRHTLLLGISFQFGKNIFRNAHSTVAFFHVHAFDFRVAAHDFYGANANQLGAGVGTEHVGTTFEQDLDGVEVAVFPAIQFDLEGIQFGDEGLHLLVGGGDGSDGDRCHVNRLRVVEGG